MNHSDTRKPRRRGAYAAVLSAAAGAALAAAMIPVAPAFADPTDDAVGAAAIKGGGLEQIADKDLYAYIDAHDGSVAATQAVETLNTDVSGLSTPAASWLEEFTILLTGGGMDMTPPDLAALLP